MDWIVAALMALGVPTAFVYAYYLRQRDNIVSWRAALEFAGLTHIEEGSPLWGASVVGWAGPQRVRFEEYSPQKNETGTRITISGNSGITLRPENLQTAIEKAIGAHEVEIGDEAFDREVYVFGAPAVLRALLDADTRQAVREILKGQARVGNFHLPLGAEVAVRDGELVAEFRERAGLRAEAPESLRALLDLARRLQRPPDPAPLLVAIAESDPEWRVRMLTIQLLAESFALHPLTGDALRRGCQDERQEVQLAAARALGGEEARAILVEIASREWTDDACAAGAVTALGKHLPVERAVSILTHALRTRRLATAAACLETLGRLGGPKVVAPLSKVLSIEGEALAAAAARALGVAGAQAAEEVLIEALASESGAVRVAAAEALGRVGGPAAVLPLKEVVTRHMLALDLRRAARQAVAEIQSRLGGASPGQLSLAQAEAGGLSLAEDSRGRVSMAEPAAPNDAGSTE